MVENSELLRVPAFADLPDDQIAWFISQSQELHYKAGDTYLRQGTPADAMFVILEGQLELHGEMGGETVAFSHEGGRRYRNPSVFENEAIYGEWARRHRQPRLAISGGAVSGSRAEDAGVGQAAGGPDVRPHPRNHPDRTTTRPVGRLRQTFRGLGSRTQ